VDKEEKRPRRILAVTTPSGATELWSNIRVFAEHYGLNPGTIRTYLYRSALKYRGKTGRLQYHRDAVTVFGFKIQEQFINKPALAIEATDAEDAVSERKTKNELTKEK